MTNCRYCDAVTRNFAYDVCDRCAGEISLAKPQRTQKEVRYTTEWQRVPAPEWMRCQKWPETMEGGCDKPAGHDGFCSGPTKQFDRGMLIYDFPCSCGRTIRAADRDRGKRCEHKPTYLHCGGCDVIHEADAAFVHRESCPLCGWPLDAADMPEAYNPSAADVDRAVARIKAATEPRPPTLREWLGDHVSELGRWTDVLREQPVPAGRITSWRWIAQPDGGWVLHMVTGTTHAQVLPDGVPYIPEHGGPWADAMLSVLFTRHPDVKPEPRPAAIVCEDQHEVMS